MNEKRDSSSSVSLGDSSGSFSTNAESFTRSPKAKNLLKIPAKDDSSFFAFLLESSDSNSSLGQSQDEILGTIETMRSSNARDGFLGNDSDPSTQIQSVSTSLRRSINRLIESPPHKSENEVQGFLAYLAGYDQSDTQINQANSSNPPPAKAPISADMVDPANGFYSALLAKENQTKTEPDVSRDGGFFDYLISFRPSNENQAEVENVVDVQNLLLNKAGNADLEKQASQPPVVVNPPEPSFFDFFLGGMPDSDSEAGAHTERPNISVDVMSKDEAQLGEPKVAGKESKQTRKVVADDAAVPADKAKSEEKRRLDSPFASPDSEQIDAQLLALTSGKEIPQDAAIQDYLQSSGSDDEGDMTVTWIEEQAFSKGGYGVDVEILTRRSKPGLIGIRLRENV